jgi:hypothetical protein
VCVGGGVGGGAGVLVMAEQGWRQRLLSLPWLCMVVPVLHVIFSCHVMLVAAALVHWACAVCAGALRSCQQFCARVHASDVPATVCCKGNLHCKAISGSWTLFRLPSISGTEGNEQQTVHTKDNV